MPQNMQQQTRQPAECSSGVSSGKALKVRGEVSRRRAWTFILKHFVTKYLIYLAVLVLLFLFSLADVIPVLQEQTRLILGSGFIVPLSLKLNSLC